MLQGSGVCLQKPDFALGELEVRDSFGSSKHVDVLFEATNGPVSCLRKVTLL